MHGLRGLAGVAALATVLALCAAYVRPAVRTAEPEFFETASFEPFAARMRYARPGAPNLPCALFAPGTPEEVVARVTQAMFEEAGINPFQRYDLHATAWFGGTGSAGNLRYSFVPDGTHIPSGFSGDQSGQSVLHSRMNTLFPGGPTVWKPLFAQVFGRWSEITGMTYTEVTDDGASFPTSAGGATRGDIRIAMRNIDGFNGVLAFNHFPTTADMVLDSSENWASTFGDYRYLRNTVAHEHGHGLGLYHICPINASKLMEPFLNTIFEGPQHDDIRGAQYLYGDQYEPNNTAGAPAYLGAIPYFSTVTVADGNVRNTSDNDYFSFGIPANSRVTVTLTPVGEQYPQADQNFDGSCPSGTTFNSASVLNMSVSLLSPALTVLATANSQPAGSMERILNHPLANAGTYFVRVIGSTGSGTQSQAYTLQVEVRNIPTQPCPEDVNADGQVNATDLANLIGTWGTSNPASDINDDGVVNAHDLARVLAKWGICI